MIIEEVYSTRNSRTYRYVFIAKSGKRYDLTEFGNRVQSWMK